MLSRKIVVILVCVIFFILILINYFTSAYILQSATNDLQKNIIKSSSSRIVEWLGERIDDVQIVQSLVNGRDRIKDRVEIKDNIRSGSTVSSFAYVFIGYKDNTTISSRSWDTPLTYATTSRPWYQETIKNGSTTITEPYLSDPLHSLVISICTPLKDKNDVEGVLCGVLPLEYIKNEILDISLPYDGKAFLVDKDKRIIVHPDEKEIFKTFSYSTDNDIDVKTTDLLAKDYIFSQGFIDYGKWHLILQLNKDQVYERINFQLKLHFIIYTLSLITFVWLNLFYNRNQKESDAKLKTAHTLVQHFMSYSDRGVLIADPEHNITFHNKQLIDLLHVNKDDIQKKLLSHDCSLFKNLDEPVQYSIFEIIKDVIERKHSYEKTFIFQDKTDKYLLFTAIAVVNKEGVYDGIIFFIKDITKDEKSKKDKKEQEDILFQQSKMADLGEMIGAISHQWRQPLNAVSILLGNLLQFKEMGCLDDETFKENLEHALSNTHYLAQTIDTFQNFYRSNKTLQTFDVLEAINDTNFILEPYFKNSAINIDIAQENKQYSCYNYKNEFQQIIASLMINAKDALLEQVNQKDMYIKIRITETDNMYQISLEDNGKGIHSSIKTTLFHPFKTTKGEKGTGNGLYLSQLIARKKLLGDLKLVSHQNPTVFLLRMSKRRKG